MKFTVIIKQKLDFVIKLNNLFDQKEKLHFFGVLSVSLFMALFQALGVAFVLPFINLVMNQNIIYENHRINQLYGFLGFTTAHSFIIFMGFAALGIIIVGNAISALAVWLKLRFVWRKSHKLSITLLRKYLTLPYAYFLTQHSADLSKNILVEVQNFTKGLLLPLLSIITGGVVAIAILATLFYVDPLITFIVAGAIIIFYLIVYLNFRIKLQIRGRRRIAENKERFKSAAEALGGIKDIKILGREKYFLQKFTWHSKQYSFLQSWSEIIGQLPRYVMEIVAFGGVVGLILFLLSSRRDGSQIIPLVSFFVFAGYRLMPVLQEIFKSLTEFQFNKAVLDKIHKDIANGWFDAKIMTLSDGSLEPTPFKRSIQLKNISYTYPGSRGLVLNNINLEIKRNTSIAVIGSTGSGKTTLVDIILGLLTPSAGTIKIDELVLTDRNVKNWQCKIGYVPQYIYLADDTITRNIAFGLPDEKIDMAQVLRVAKIANLHDFIEHELPEKYNTLIGERGVRLSGGQRQRIGIARSLYHEPEVLVFDEATSSLDSQTEGYIIEAIERLKKNRTIIIIAHRLTTVKDCDVFHLLKNGAIVATSKHADFLQDNDEFKAIAS